MREDLPDFFPDARQPSNLACAFHENTLWFKISYLESVTQTNNKKKNRTNLDEESDEKPLSLYTIKLTEDQIKKLHHRLSRDRDFWEFSEKDYAHFAAKRDKVNVVAYESGKLVVQGKETKEFVEMILEPEITGEVRLGYDEVHHPEWFEAHAGMDESGKGDLFGPVVVATVIANSNMVREWIKAGIKDSKGVGSDTGILRLEKIIRETKGVVAVVKTTTSGMLKYNELYQKFGNNLNKLLAWLHAKTIEEALAKKKVPWGLLDQFSKADLVGPHLKKIENFELRQRTKAESDPVVAAASILARAGYVKFMRRLSDEAGFPLLKGASAKVREQAERIVKEQGEEALPRFAKMHFRTAYEALGKTPPPKVKWNKKS